MADPDTPRTVPEDDAPSLKERIRERQEAANITKEDAAKAFLKLLKDSKCPGCGEYVGHLVRCPYRARLVDGN